MKAPTSPEPTFEPDVALLNRLQVAHRRSLRLIEYSKGIIRETREAIAKLEALEKEH
jgi:hypothetical protein